MQRTMRMRVNILRKRCTYPRVWFGGPRNESVFGAMCSRWGRTWSLSLPLVPRLSLRFSSSLSFSFTPPSTWFYTLPFLSPSPLSLSLRFICLSSSCLCLFLYYARKLTSAFVCWQQTIISNLNDNDIFIFSR